MNKKKFLDNTFSCMPKCLKGLSISAHTNTLCAQGVALGWYVSPLWGEKY
jgi:hypothetical protein